VADAGSVSSEAGGSQTVKALLELRELILGGELAAGSRISELAIGERIGVSRTPVRSALAKLREEGLLEAIPSGGYVVRAISEEEIHDAIEVRGTLEGLAARLAAERGVSVAELAPLYECIDEIDGALDQGELTDDSFAVYIQANARLHALIAELPRSPVIAREIERAISFPFASPNAFVALEASTPDARDVLVITQSQHRAVVDAIARREGARAEAIMREHARIAHLNLQNALRNLDVLRRIPGSSLIRRRGVRA